MTPDEARRHHGHLCDVWTDGHDDPELFGVIADLSAETALICGPPGRPDGAALISSLHTNCKVED